MNARPADSRSEYTPDLDGRVWIQAEVPTEAFHRKLAALDAKVDRAVVHFEEDAIRLEGGSPDNIVWIVAEETNVEYSSHEVDVTFGIDVSAFRDSARLIDLRETMTIQLKSEESDLSCSSGNTMDFCPLVDPAKIDVPDEPDFPRDWDTHAEIQGAALKAACAKVTGPASRSVYWGVEPEGFTVRSTLLTDETYSRVTRPDATTEGDPQHTFLWLKTGQSVINALPLDETVTLSLDRQLPIRIETSGGVEMVVAPQLPPDDDAYNETPPWGESDE